MTHDTLTVSIVTFNNEDTIEKALSSITGATLTSIRVVVVDNGSCDRTPDIVSDRFPGVTLIRSDNVGFGAGHNKAIDTVKGTSRYHLVMNPDVYFEPGAPEQLVNVMDNHPEVGLIMPKILYPDDSIQYLCKLLPTPFDLAVRRFLPAFLEPLFANRLRSYEMRHKDYDQQMEVPHLSGCFMLLRAEVFEKVGLFDPRFFMYLEDVDYSRRIHDRFKTLYYPGVHIYHQYHKGSYKRWKHLKYHVHSAFKYFNKWGWFLDKDRKDINKKHG
jgi:GT2 family glycosyltransferase